MATTLIAGLGNPGAEYRRTRHNIGFSIVEALATAEGVTWSHEKRFEADLGSLKRRNHQIILTKPLTYMNQCGPALKKICHYYKIPANSLIVIYDEINIELGKLKVSIKGSAGGHNGLDSAMQHLGEGFVRYRIGIGPKTPAQMDLKDFVLGRFRTGEDAIVNKKMAEYVAGLKLIVDIGPEPAMNQLNQRKPTDEPNTDKENL